jgi:hypothetical protein
MQRANRNYRRSNRSPEATIAAFPICMTTYNDEREGEEVSQILYW